MSRVFAVPEKGRAGRREAWSGYRTPASTVQPALRIGRPGDRYEREADRVADAVMRMPEAPTAVDGGNRIQRTCTGCEDELRRQPIEEEEEELLQTREIPGAVPRLTAETASAVRALPSGSSLSPGDRQYFDSRMGADFSDVRLHTGPTAASLASDLSARAFTYGRNIVFGRGEYAPRSPQGRHLMAHELTHVMQQGAAPRTDAGRASGVGSAGGSGSTGSHGKGGGPGGGGGARPPRVAARGGTRVQRAVSFDVTKWDATKLGPPVLRNNAGDQRMLEIPPTGQMQIDADVDVKGDPGDSCHTRAVGTTQSAWIASCIMDYRGQTRADGRVSVRYTASMPMRDPAPGGSVWYDAANVVNPAACGASVSVRHFDSPWHRPPKARNNTAVAGSPLNFLTRYRRGLNLVTYLTTQEGATFRRRPLKFRYWATVHDFSFTPQYPSPPANTAFLGMWPFTGAVRVIKGSSGSGETSDAPYYRTAGTEYNTHFNDIANWRITERA